MKFVRSILFFLCVAVLSSVVLRLWFSSAASEKAWTWINEQVFAGARPDHASDVEFSVAALIACMLSWGMVRFMASWVRTLWVARFRR
jgi:hypothetical protein